MGSVCHAPVSHRLHDLPGTASTAGTAITSLPPPPPAIPVIHLPGLLVDLRLLLRRTEHLGRIGLLRELPGRPLLERDGPPFGLPGQRLPHAHIVAAEDGLGGRRSAGD